VRRARGDDDDALFGTVLDRHLGVGERPGDVQKQPAGDDDRPVALDLDLERRAQRQLHIGRRELQAPFLGAQQDPGEDEHRRPRRDTARHDPELLRELVPRARQLQSGTDPYHCFCIRHL